jgi:hypothetical protein
VGDEAQQASARCGAGAHVDGQGWLSCHGSGRAATGAGRSACCVEGRLGEGRIHGVGTRGAQVTTALGEAQVSCRHGVAGTGWGQCGA